VRIYWRLNLIEVEAAVEVCAEDKVEVQSICWCVCGTVYTHKIYRTGYVQ
jgi:hypothetical protein